MFIDKKLIIVTYIFFLEDWKWCQIEGFGFVDVVFGECYSAGMNLRHGQLFLVLCRNLDFSMAITELIIQSSSILLP